MQPELKRSDDFHTGMELGFRRCSASLWLFAIGQRCREFVRSNCVVFRLHPVGCCFRAEVLILTQKQSVLTGLLAANNQSG